MKVSSFSTLLAVLGATVSLVSAAPIITAGPSLTEKTWPEATKGIWLVEHYSPYCGHCKSFAPKWRDLLLAIETPAASHNFHFAQIDCAANGDLCHDHGVKYYPSIFLYRDGEKLEEYEGKRTVAVMKAWVEEKWDEEVVLPVKVTVTGEEKESERVHVEIEQSSEDELAQEEKKVERPSPVKPKLRLAQEEDEDDTLPPVAGYTAPATTTASLSKLPLKPVRQAPPAAGAIGAAGGFLKQEHEEKRSGKGTEAVPSKADGEVHVLEADEVGRLRNQASGPAFVKYYANWCGHCKKLAPTWVKLAEEVRGQVSVYEMDCDLSQNRKACGGEKIDAYPTLVFYNEGAKVVYNGRRTLEAMSEFATKAAASTQVRSIANEYELKRATATEDVVFLFLHPSDASPDILALGKEASRQLIGGPSFYTSSSPDLFNLFSLKASPTLLVFKEHSSSPTSSLTLPASLLTIVDWVRVSKLGLVTELSGSTFHDLMPTTGNPPLVALAVLSPKRLGGRFEASKKEVEALAKAWTGRKRMGREVLWAWVDGDKWAGWAKGLYGVKAQGEEAQLLIADPKSMDFWKDGLDRHPLGIKSPSAIFKLIEEGIYTGVARPQSSRNFVDRFASKISTGGAKVTGGAVDHPLLTLVFVAVSVGLAWWGIRKLSGPSHHPSTTYAKLE